MRSSSKRKDIARLIKPHIRKLAPYHVDETQVTIKLDAMENPFPLPGIMRRGVSMATESTAINRYPDPSGKELKKAISSFWGMDPDLMILGNGSDELIQAIIIAFGGPVLVPAPTFAMYEITSRALEQEVAFVPLNKDFSLDPDKLLKAAASVEAKIIFLACPNNPTANRFADDAVVKILSRANAAVVIDEAYFSFSGKSHLSMLKKYPNMIILRTLSKIGFAGLRLGILTASPAVVAEINKIRLPYNINALSQAAAIAALRHKDLIESQISLLISEREKLYNELSRLQGVTPYPSETNFILLRTVSDAAKTFLKLKQAGILVKNLSKPGPLKNCLRVTIGTPEENRTFIAELKKILG